MCYMRCRRRDVGVRELRQNATALDRLIAARRATAAAGDLLDLGPPRGKRPSRRASRALAKLREDRA